MSSGGPQLTLPGGKTVRIYRFRNPLKDKATAGGGGTGPGALSAQSLAEAEAVFLRLAEDYPDWVETHLQRMEQHYQRCVGRPELRPLLFKGLNDVAHELKGQGGTFGYPLVTVIADSLDKFTRPRETFEDELVELVRAHLDAIRTIIHQRIKGDGGELGKELVIAMQKAVRKFGESDR